MLQKENKAILFLNIKILILPSCYISGNCLDRKISSILCCSVNFLSPDLESSTGSMCPCEDTYEDTSCFASIT